MRLDGDTVQVPDEGNIRGVINTEESKHVNPARNTEVGADQASRAEWIEDALRIDHYETVPGTNSGTAVGGRPAAATVGVDNKGKKISVEEIQMALGLAEPNVAFKQEPETQQLLDPFIGTGTTFSDRRYVEASPAEQKRLLDKLEEMRALVYKEENLSSPVTELKRRKIVNRLENKKQFKNLVSELFDNKDNYNKLMTAIWVKNGGPKRTENIDPYSPDTHMKLFGSGYEDGTLAKAPSIIDMGHAAFTRSNLTRNAFNAASMLLAKERKDVISEKEAQGLAYDLPNWNDRQEVVKTATTYGRDAAILQRDRLKEESDYAEKRQSMGKYSRSFAETLGGIAPILPLTPITMPLATGLRAAGMIRTASTINKAGELLAADMLGKTVFGIGSAIVPLTVASSAAIRRSILKINKDVEQETLTYLADNGAGNKLSAVGKEMGTQIPAMALFSGTSGALSKVSANAPGSTLDAFLAGAEEGAATGAVFGGINLLMHAGVSKIVNKVPYNSYKDMREGNRKATDVPEDPLSTLRDTTISTGDGGTTENDNPMLDTLSGLHEISELNERIDEIYNNTEEKPSTGTTEVPETSETVDTQKTSETLKPEEPISEPATAEPTTHEPTEPIKAEVSEENTEIGTKESPLTEGDLEGASITDLSSLTEAVTNKVETAVEQQTYHGELDKFRKNPMYSAYHSMIDFLKSTWDIPYEEQDPDVLSSSGLYKGTKVILKTGLSEGFRLKVLLHEGWHHLTARGIEKDVKIKEELERIQEVLRAPENAEKVNKIPAGKVRDAVLSSPHELVAHGMTHASVREVLDSIQDPVAKKGTTLWGAIKRMLYSMRGWDADRATPNSLLDSVILAAERAMEHNPTDGTLELHSLEEEQADIMSGVESLRREAAVHKYIQERYDTAQKALEKAKTGETPLHELPDLLGIPKDSLDPAKYLSILEKYLKEYEALRDSANSGEIQSKRVLLKLAKEGILDKQGYEYLKKYSDDVTLNEPVPQKTLQNPGKDASPVSLVAYHTWLALNEPTVSRLQALTKLFDKEKNNKLLDDEFSELKRLFKATMIALDIKRNLRKAVSEIFATEDMETSEIPKASIEAWKTEAQRALREYIKETSEHLAIIEKELTETLNLYTETSDVHQGENKTHQNLLIAQAAGAASRAKSTLELEKSLNLLGKTTKDRYSDKLKVTAAKLPELKAELDSIDNLQLHLIHRRDSEGMDISKEWDDLEIRRKRVAKALKNSRRAEENIKRLQASGVAGDRAQAVVELSAALGVPVASREGLTNAVIVEGVLYIPRKSSGKELIAGVLSALLSHKPSLESPKEVMEAHERAVESAKALAKLIKVKRAPKRIVKIADKLEKGNLEALLDLLNNMDKLPKKQKTVINKLKDFVFTAAVDLKALVLRIAGLPNDNPDMDVLGSDYITSIIEEKAKGIREDVTGNIEDLITSKAPYEALVKEAEKLLGDYTSPRRIVEVLLKQKFTTDTKAIKAWESKVRGTILKYITKIINIQAEKHLLSRAELHKVLLEKWQILKSIELLDKESVSLEDSNKILQDIKEALTLENFRGGSVRSYSELQEILKYLQGFKGSTKVGDTTLTDLLNKLSAKLEIQKLNKRLQEVTERLDKHTAAWKSPEVRNIRKRRILQEEFSRASKAILSLRLELKKNPTQEVRAKILKQYLIKKALKFETSRELSNIPHQDFSSLALADLLSHPALKEVPEGVYGKLTSMVNSVHSLETTGSIEIAKEKQTEVLSKSYLELLRNRLLSKPETPANKKLLEDISNALKEHDALWETSTGTNNRDEKGLLNRFSEYSEIWSDHVARELEKRLVPDELEFKRLLEAGELPNLEAFKNYLESTNNVDTLNWLVSICSALHNPVGTAKADSSMIKALKEYNQMLKSSIEPEIIQNIKDTLELNFNRVLEHLYNSIETLQTAPLEEKLRIVQLKRIYEVLSDKAGYALTEEGFLNDKQLGTLVMANHILENLQLDNFSATEISRINNIFNRARKDTYTVNWYNQVQAMRTTVLQHEVGYSKGDDAVKLTPEDNWEGLSEDDIDLMLNSWQTTGTKFKGFPEDYRGTYGMFAKTVRDFIGLDDTGKKVSSKFWEEKDLGAIEDEELYTPIDTEDNVGGSIIETTVAKESAKLLEMYEDANRATRGVEFDLARRETELARLSALLREEAYRAASSGDAESLAVAATLRYNAVRLKLEYEDRLNQVKETERKVKELLKLYLGKLKDIHDTYSLRNTLETIAENGELTKQEAELKSFIDTKIAELEGRVDFKAGKTLRYSRVSSAAADVKKMRVLESNPEWVDWVEVYNLDTRTLKSEMNLLLDSDAEAGPGYSDMTYLEAATRVMGRYKFTPKVTEFLTKYLVSSMEPQIGVKHKSWKETVDTFLTEIEEEYDRGKNKVWEGGDLTPKGQRELLPKDPWVPSEAWWKTDVNSDSYKVYSRLLSDKGRRTVDEMIKNSDTTLALDRLNRVENLKSFLRLWEDQPGFLGILTKLNEGIDGVTLKNITETLRTYVLDGSSRLPYSSDAKNELRKMLPSEGDLTVENLQNLLNTLRNSQESLKTVEVRVPDSVKLENAIFSILGNTWKDTYDIGLLKHRIDLAQIHELIDMKGLELLEEQAHRNTKAVLQEYDLDISNNFEPDTLKFVDISALPSWKRANKELGNLRDTKAEDYLEDEVVSTGSIEGEGYDIREGAAETLLIGPNGLRRVINPVVEREVPIIASDTYGENAIKLQPKIVKEDVLRNIGHTGGHIVPKVVSEKSRAVNSWLTQEELQSIDANTPIEYRKVRTQQDLDASFMISYKQYAKAQRGLEAEVARMFAEQRKSLIERMDAVTTKLDKSSENTRDPISNQLLRAQLYGKSEKVSLEDTVDTVTSLIAKQLTSLRGAMKSTKNSLRDSTSTEKLTESLMKLRPVRSPRETVSLQDPGVFIKKLEGISEALKVASEGVVKGVTAVSSSDKAKAQESLEKLLELKLKQDKLYNTPGIRENLENIIHTIKSQKNLEEFAEDPLNKGRTIRKRELLRELVDNLKLMEQKDLADNIKHLEDTIKSMEVRGLGNFVGLPNRSITVLSEDIRRVLLDTGLVIHEGGRKLTLLQDVTVEKLKENLIAEALVQLEASNKLLPPCK